MAVQNQNIISKFGKKSENWWSFNTEAILGKFNNNLKKVKLKETSQYFTKFQRKKVFKKIYVTEMAHGCGCGDQVNG